MRNHINVSECKYWHRESLTGFKRSIEDTQVKAQVIRDVPVNHPVLGICRVSHYPVLPGPGKIIDPSKFIFFKVKY